MVKRCRFVNAVVWVLVLTLTFPVVTFAGDPPDKGRPEPPSSDESTVEIVPPGDGNGSGDVTIQGSYLGAYGCYGQTDRPHRSTHVPGTVNVISQTYCSIAMSSLYVAVDLYKVEWWGWDKDFISSNVNAGAGTSRVRTNTSGTCNSGDYEGQGYHQVQFPNGTWGSAATLNSANVSC